ncbi:hydroxyacid dehydrogenase [Terrilactibacillus sp. BCM23-1]|uniref:Hydroxyacid dehydrogenase n=1 Tax=Terrilactibacillus tamarindi TaxID=2599694 RepID=A0A6N8CUK6_9BACI|nr:hydroxyacid dehydrogenase [Terrilactibacillus tamarindi]MTT31816.1 hydroxyacid dehydrogenase [Terrilactibacillus tamarindi]
MTKPRILQILSMYHENGEHILQENATVVKTNTTDTNHLCNLVQDVSGIILRAPARINKEIIDASTNLRAISGAGIGLDNIDVEAATEKGIAVLHAPNVSAVSTAEHALSLMMALSKSIIPFHQEMRKANFMSRDSIKTYEIKGKVVGLIGFGNIAQELASRLTFGLKMKVIAWVRSIDRNKELIATQLNVELSTNIETLISKSDFISIHVPLNKETKHLIDQRLLSLMKTSAYLINTARGAIIDNKALIDSLVKRKIAGAALDVFDPEPPLETLELLKLPNVILTPHVGGTTVECNVITSMTIATNLIRFLNGKPVDTIVNPEVLS